MSIRKNISANYAGAGISTAAAIVALPWYVSALGPQQWGLVSFVVLLQALLGLLDAGISQALIRELAVRLSMQASGRARAAALLLGFEQIYWVFAVCAGVALAVLAQTISTRWLNTGDVLEDLSKHVVYGAALLFLTQFPGSVYRSALAGAQAQVTLNSIMIVANVLRHAGGVGVVLIWPTIYAYLLWQILIAVGETGARAIFAWRAIGVRRAGTRWDSEEMRSIGPLVARLSLATLLGVLTMQMDKVLVSGMLTVEELGYYSIAASVALGALQMIYPITQAALPKMVGLRSSPPALRRLAMRVAALLILVSITVAVAFAAAGREVLEAWLGSAAVASVVYTPLVLLLIGSGLNALYNVGYLFWLAHGQATKVLQVNALSLLLSLVLCPVFIEWYGLVGAAVGWVVVNLVGLVLSAEWLFKYRRAQAPVSDPVELARNEQ